MEVSMPRLASALLSAALLWVGLALPGAATALPILSVDADPALPGVQSERAVALGAFFDVAIFVEAVDSDHPLHAFELTLAHGTSLDGPVVTLGDFLGVDALLILAAPSSAGFEIAATRLGPEGRNGAGVLAIVRFSAGALGSSPLDLNDVVLSEPFGLPLATESIRGASIRVVPEVETGVLLLTGLVALARRRSADA